MRERTANFRKFPALVAPVKLRVPTSVLDARKLGWLGNKYTQKHRARVWEASDTYPDPTICPLLKLSSGCLRGRCLMVLIISMNVLGTAVTSASLGLGRQGLTWGLLPPGYSCGCVRTWEGLQHLSQTRHYYCVVREQGSEKGPTLNSTHTPFQTDISWVQLEIIIQYGVCDPGSIFHVSVYLQYNILLFPKELGLANSSSRPLLHTFH